VGSARSAASLPVARQVADAGVVAGLAVEADRRSLPTVRPGEDGSGASESFADLALRVSPARRQAVTTIVADRRLDEAEADPSGPGARERALIARDALVDLAQAILAETPAPPPSPADPALLPRLRRDLLALHGARFGELWAVLAGDPGELAPARAAVDAAAQVAA